MIRSGLILMIKDLAGKDKSAYAIGQEIGVSKNTARKYMTQSAQPHGLKGIKRGSKLDPYKAQLDGWMRQGVFNCVVLMERLRAMGYDGGMSILKEYVHPYRPAKSAPAVRRYETPSGKQAQMDWGICQYLDQNGVLHKVAVFVMILGHSRAKYIEFVSRCDLRSMERCMLNAFLYFGGVPKEVLTDNMKTVVAGREAGKVIWNTQFADFAAEIGFVYRCPKCGHEEQLLTGIGFMAQQEAATECENILAGIYGPKVKTALVAHPESAVSVERAVYQCGACGKLESRLAVKVSAPVRVSIHQHCDCGKIMHRIRAGEEMFCPVCLEPLKETNIVSAILWD